MWTQIRRAINWKTFFWVLGIIWFLATIGLWVGTAIPYVGTVFFVTGLAIWLAAGIALAWSGSFEFHEFGASPTGPMGYVLMFVLIALIALFAGWCVAKFKARKLS